MTLRSNSMYGLLSAIAQSGDYLDCWALEVKLRTLGFSPAEAREALSDAEDRKALLALCITARSPPREEQLKTGDATFQQLLAKI